MMKTNLVAIAGLRLPLHLVDCQVVQAVLVVVAHLDSHIISRCVSLMWSPGFNQDCYKIVGWPFIQWLFVDQFEQGAPQGWENVTSYHSTVIDWAVSTVACLAVLREALVLAITMIKMMFGQNWEKIGISNAVFNFKLINNVCRIMNFIRKSIKIGSVWTLETLECMDDGDDDAD